MSHQIRNVNEGHRREFLTWGDNIYVFQMLEAAALISVLLFITVFILFIYCLC